MIGFRHQTFEEMDGAGTPSLVKVQEDLRPGWGDGFALDDGEGVAASGVSTVSVGFAGSDATLKFMADPEHGRTSFDLDEGGGEAM